MGRPDGALTGTWQLFVPEVSSLDVSSRAKTCLLMPHHPDASWQLAIGASVESINSERVSGMYNYYYELGNWVKSSGILQCRVLDDQLVEPQSMQTQGPETDMYGGALVRDVGLTLRFDKQGRYVRGVWQAPKNLFSSKQYQVYGRKIADNVEGLPPAQQRALENTTPRR